MSLRNNLSLLLRNSLGLFGARLIRLAPDKVRGIDPILDLKFLLKGNEAPVIVDVGANDGEMADEFLATFKGARLVAFEPFAESFRVLQERFKGNPNVTMENVALGAVPGKSVLHVFSGNRMNSLLEMADHPDNIMKGKFPETGATEVAVDTLDNYCARHNLPSIDILKTDTQGFDLNVLKGAAGLLQQHRIKTIVLEINFIPMYQEQASFMQLHEYLGSMGYRLVDFYNQVNKDGYTAWADACYVACPESAGTGR